MSAVTAPHSGRSGSGHPDAKGKAVPEDQLVLRPGSGTERAERLVEEAAVHIVPEEPEYY